MVHRLLDPNESPTFGNSLLLRVDGAIGAMSVSPNGRDSVLAGRRGLFIIDLDDPFTPPRWLHHITSWEVADVQWSPHNFIKPSWCISTSNQKGLLWDLNRPSNNAIVNILHGHTRAISDINFHPFDPEVLATCSVDTFIYSWDMRTPRKPVSQWAEWRAGAIQVKWNHENPYEIALTHDNSFYIWDTRKGALPVVKVDKAHGGKINGLDFNQGMKNIITCSNDKTIKTWNLMSLQAQEYISNFNYFDKKKQEDNKLQPSVIIETDFPIARARSLPFGSDKACGIMPLRGGSDAIQIVNYDAAYHDYLSTGETQTIQADPIYSFKGHSGPVKDFLWRVRHESYEEFDSKNKWKEYQLVTWSALDCDLKLWQHDENLYKKVNYDPTFYKVFRHASDLNDLDSEGTSSRPHTPISHEKKPKYKYETYCVEPAVTIDDLVKNNGGDLLSSLTLLQISENHKHAGYEFTQLNHLNWISGVRMGRPGGAAGAPGSVSRAGDRKQSTTSTYDDDGPSNLGEEVSIVGHKFPKIRFEKISVSTGELVMSLRGPLPVLEAAPIVQGIDTTTNNGANRHDSNASVKASTTKSDDWKPEGDQTSVKDNESTRKTEPLVVSPSVIHEESLTSAEQKLVFIRINMKFPKNYPYLEEIDYSKTMSSKKLAKILKQNLIKFNIEETHEITKQIRDQMQDRLNEIAQFYTNKYQRFCLEPCLRSLMGEQVELDDALILMETRGNKELDEEVGNEDWVDDLINQQPDLHGYSSGEDEGDYNDLIPAMMNDSILVDRSGASHIITEPKLANASVSTVTKIAPGGAMNFDSTPLPKGCGAVWAPSGQLVCFFIPKSVNDNKDDSDPDEEGNESALQKFNIFKFTDSGFSLKTHNIQQQHHHHSLKQESLESASDEEENEDDINMDLENPELDRESLTSGSSDDSFTNDWDEILEDDAPARSRIPGLFKTSIGLGNRYSGRSHTKSSFKNLTSHGGTTSNYKSSIRGGAGKKKKLRAEFSKNKNIVGIFDFSHLLPDKYPLACEYRVLGDSPESLANYNSKVALKYGLQEISDIWKILEIILIKNVPLTPYSHFNPMLYYAKDPDNLILHSDSAKKIFKNDKHTFYWGTHPFGPMWLIQSIFDYFEKKNNVQMLAMMSCILYENPKSIEEEIDPLFNVPIHTPYQALPQPPVLAPNRSKLHQGLFNTNSLFGGSGHPSVPHLQAMIHDNSSLLSLLMRKGSLFSGATCDRSFNSSLDAASIRIGSPDKVAYMKKNIALGITPSGPSNNSYSSLGESYNETYRFSTQQQQLQDTKRTKPSTLLRRPITAKSSKGKVRPPPSVMLEFENIEELDLFENVYTRSLLSGQDPLKIKSYREQYAELLYNWGLHVSRVKILKFNFPEGKVATNNNEEEDDSSPFDIHKCKIGLRKRKRQLPYQNFLNAVSTIVSPDGPNAWNTNKRAHMKYCTLCNLVVTKNFTVCIVCEHVLHTDCGVEWWTNGNECPSGCGCKCLEHTI